MVLMDIFPDKLDSFFTEPFLGFTARFWGEGAAGAALFPAPFGEGAGFL
ncbi:MAG: hypothetical protein J2P21_12545 [Chloracidobacterium sp.]|nr:hypothetical protein [Chloracidobacterium sp.]